MPPAEFEPTIPASERSHIYALDRAATGIGEFPVTGEIKSRYPFHGKVPVGLIRASLFKNFTAFHNTLNFRRLTSTIVDVPHR